MAFEVTGKEVVLGSGETLKSDGATRIAGKAAINGLGWRVWRIFHYGVGCLGNDRVQEAWRWRGWCFSRYPCLIHVCHMLSQHFHFFYQPVVLFDQLLSVISTDPLGSAVLSHCPLILLCREELPQPTTFYIWTHQREAITLVLGHWTDNHVSEIQCT